MSKMPSESAEVAAGIKECAFSPPLEERIRRLPRKLSLGEHPSVGDSKEMRYALRPDEAEDRADGVSD